ncbi:MAG: DUF2752 domain-containing protein [Candidatus Eremiobacterota bacterium]
MKNSIFSNIFLNKFTTITSLLVIIISFILPTDGLDRSTCGLYILTKLPCPACGLTRSVTSISHIKFTKAFYYHPFGFIFYIIFLFLALYNFMPEKIKDIIKIFFIKNEDIIRYILLFLICSFMIYGIARFFYVLII